VVGLVLSVLGSSSMAVGLLLLAASLDVSAGAFLGYLIVQRVVSWRRRSDARRLRA
jgi:hypothetical protein